MKVKCVQNHISVAPKKYHKFAFTQDDDGIVDLTEGKTYEVYGTRRSGKQDVDQETGEQHKQRWLD